jgi:hypothetical protein
LEAPSKLELDRIIGAADATHPRYRITR